MSQPSREIHYTQRHGWADVLQWQRDNKVSCPIEYNGSAIVCTSGTFTLYNPARAAVVNAAAVSIDAGNNAVYTVLAASLPSTVLLGEGWLEVWSLVLPDGTRTFDRVAAVAKTLLYPVVTDADLTEEQPSILTHAGSAVTSFQAQRTSAWKEILSALAAGGWLSYTLKDASAFREWHLFLTLAKIYRGFMSSAARGSWKDLAEHYDGRASTARSQMSFQLSEEKDRFVVDSHRREGNFTLLNRNGSPGRSYPAGY